ncbi:MAG: DUF218 domain-containing protein [Clostridiaceae bacterium]|nr:DUF218 domain-containing protein [Clostridiaceae bacterium]
MKKTDWIFSNIRELNDCAKETARLMKKGPLSVPMVWLNILYFRLRYHIPLIDYVRYRFWENTRIKLLNHYTRADNIRLVETINDQDKIQVLRDKMILLRRLGDRLGRDFTDIRESSEEAFFSFLKQHKKVIVKPRFGACGIGIRVLDRPYSEEEAMVLRQELIKGDCTLAEEFIRQHPDINRINNQAVDVLKIHTLKIGTDIQIVLVPMFQIGKKNATYSHSGFMLPVDMQTGSLIFQDPTPDELRDLIPKDYRSGKPLPFFRESLRLAEDLGKIVPELSFICWDIAIGEHGPVPVEGNGASGAFNEYQSHIYATTGLGAKTRYTKILQYSQARKSLGNDGLREIEDFLFYETEPKRPFDILWVLGSSRCGDRIRSAAIIAGENPDLQIVLSGGNICLEQFDPDENVLRTESEYMREFLIRSGIPEKRIRIENQSTHTAENLDFFLKLLERENVCPRPVGKICIGVVTAGFHMRRVFNRIHAHPEHERYDWVSSPVYSERTSKENWYKNIEGFEIILAEYDRLRSNHYE